MKREFEVERLGSMHATGGCVVPSIERVLLLEMLRIK